MAISDAQIAQIRAETDLVALISERVALKRQGRRWSGLCPFHAEKTPSFSVNGEQGLYYCFGCRASGDAIKFVREIQHLDFRQALEFLADRAHIELIDDAESGPRRKERQALFDAMTRAVEYYHDRLLSAPDARPAREYLKNRGIDGDAARQFRLGWAPDEWSSLADHLAIPIAVLQGAGLGFQNSRGRAQDFLRARIVFPISDSSGRPIAVGGRILPGAPLNGRAEPKYKNSPETPIYSKRRILYALDLAKDDVIRSGEVIVCEGYTDVIGMFLAGLPRAVATCGTSLTEEHFQTLRNFARKVLLAYDADSAGQSAAASVYQWERKHEVDVAVVTMPPGSDPGELAQNDPEALRTAVAGAIPFLQFRLNRVLASADLSTAEGRSRASQVAAAVIAEHHNELVRDDYARRVADQCRIDIEMLRPLIERARHAGPATVNLPPAPTARPASETSRPGRAALAVLVHQPDAIEGRLTPAMFTDPVQHLVYEVLAQGALVPNAVDSLEAREENDAADLLRELAVEELPPSLTTEREVSSVVAQLIRGASTAALKEVDRDVRGRIVTPESANQVMRDVKSRLIELEGPRGLSAEGELRDWLTSREG